MAYSSVSHLGFVMLGLFALNPQGIEGGILQMVNHGLSTGALFLLVGMIYERRHTREMAEFGGLWKVMPVYAVLTLIVIAFFDGPAGPERLCRRVHHPAGRLGCRRAGVLGSVLYAGFGAAGVILAAVYMLFMFGKMFLGR